MYCKLICILYALLCGQKIYSCKKWVLQIGCLDGYKMGDFGQPIHYDPDRVISSLGAG
jgi:hypothetical protein